MAAADTTADVFGNVKSYLASPFSTGMSAGGWFLFFGLILAISVAWGLVLKDLKGEL